MEIGTFRQQHPEYNDMSDPALAQALHKKYYSDMPLEDFTKKFLTATATPTATTGGLPQGLPQQSGVSTLEGVGTGLMDSAVGIGQASAHAMDMYGKNDPFSTLGMLDKVRRGAAGLMGVGAESADVDKAVAAREQAIQAKRGGGSITDLVTGEKSGPGIDWPRMGGNVLGALAMPGVGAASFMGRMGMGALQGAALNAAQPVTTGDYASEKMKQTGLGALTGGIATPIAGKIGDIISPRISKDVKTLMDAGITPPPGAALGGAIAKMEDQATSIPLLGMAVSAGKRRAINEFNEATYNKALAPIGQTAEKGLVGPEGVLGVKTALSDVYKQLLPKLTFVPDQELAATVAATTAKAQRELPLDQARIFTNKIDDLRGTPTPNGTLTGQAYQDLMSDLGKDIKKYTGSLMASERTVGERLLEVRDAMKAALNRSNPDYAKDLDAVNLGWANYARIRGAAKSLGKDDVSGVFTPAQLLRSVQVEDKSVSKGDFATGKAFMQDWAQAGKSVLGSKYPDSGTAGRLGFGALMAGGAHSLGFLSPEVATAGAAASLMYTPAGQKLMAAMLTKRPAWAPGVANYAQRALSPLAPAALPSLLKASEE